LLGLIVLVQNSKGGGLASGFGGSSQVMGVRKTADFLEKVTWGLAISLVVFCVIGSLILPTTEVQQQNSQLQQKIDEVAVPESFPTAPAEQPAQQEAAPGE
jgi:preprotein translocase subunit SecG